MSMVVGPGLYLNAHEIQVSGRHRLWRLRNVDRPARRTVLSATVGAPVFVSRKGAYAVRKVSAELADEVPYDPVEDHDILRFVIREGLASLASSKGFEAWFGFGGEVSCADTERPLLSGGPVIVESVLHLRVNHEGPDEDMLLLIARHDVRWRFSASLADPELAQLALGEPVVRVGGDGPRRGRLLELARKHATLIVGEQQMTFPAHNYSLAANPALVYKVLGRAGHRDADAVVRRLLRASRSLLENGRPNQYAVKERQEAALAFLERLGWTFDLPDGSVAEVSQRPVEVRLRG